MALGPGTVQGQGTESVLPALPQPSLPASPPIRATGEIEIVWPGGKGRMVPPGEEKLAFAAFEAFVPDAAHPEPRGEFHYLVVNPDLTLHREIVAPLIRVDIDLGLQKGVFIGIVASDDKACGHSGSTHDAGCDGGCSGGDEDGHDGGCSGDTDGSTHEGGCSGSDGTSHDDGCSGGGSGGSGDPAGPGGSVSGRGSRVGQVVVIKVHDGGTPATNGDGMTWRWFPPATTEAELQAWLDRDLVAHCPHLCKKTLIGGNLVVHPAD